MQTFLPYPSFVQSAKVLDYRRLGKQRLECKQILAALDCQILRGELQRVREPVRSGWTHHPAVLMWRGYEKSLAMYATVMIMEWMGRGYNNTQEKLRIGPDWSQLDPPWLGDESFHASHRSNLLRKDPTWYGKFGWIEPDNLPYVWPTVPVSGPQKSSDF